MIENNTTPVDLLTTTHPLSTSPKPKLPQLLIIISILFTSTVALAYYAFIFQKNQSFSPTTQPTNNTSTISPTLTPKFSNTPSTLPLESINPGILTWLKSSQVVKLDVLYPSDSQEYFDQSIIESSFNQVADFADGSKLINGYITQQGMGEHTSVYRFIQTPDSTIYLIMSNESSNYQDPRTLFNNSVKYTNYQPTGVETPQYISSTKTQYVSSSNFFMNTILFSELKNPELVDTTPYGSVYVVYQPSHKPGIWDRNLWLRLKDNTVKYYDVNNSFVHDDRVPAVTWTDGNSNNQVYNRGFKGGCGSITGNVIKNNSIMLNGKFKVGQTSTGLDIYQTNNSQILGYIYESLDSSTAPEFNAWVNTHNHFLVQDGLGDWQVFVSDQYMVQAECGKPVIYLYPQKDTQVSVEVGANITQSEPLYPQGGWTVLAHPNGQLEYQGQTYPNLFWEGKGQGIYPNMDNLGFVVTQKELIPTVKSHLTKLGLNSQESKDFLDFWTSKLPSTPYIRLTWLGTADMNQLAPLQISPRPDTTIRLFLDFSGLDKPVKLIPQQLSAPARSGFTLVEWGGLLIK